MRVHPALEALVSEFQGRLTDGQLHVAALEAQYPILRTVGDCEEIATRVHMYGQFLEELGEDLSPDRQTSIAAGLVRRSIEDINEGLRHLPDPPDPGSSE